MSLSLTGMYTEFSGKRSLIFTNKQSDDNYIKKTNNGVKKYTGFLVFVQNVVGEHGAEKSQVNLSLF